MLKIHENIKAKLQYFHEIHKVPNIIFHGPPGSGKKTIVFEFINMLYINNKDKIKDYLNIVNCSHMKGIKFIREELKFFAKTNINSNDGDIFKSIVLLNADKLTIDAQSALRRCIELFSQNTRFFIVVEDKYKLLKPIISRFCEIYIGEPKYNNKSINNLHKYNINKIIKLSDCKNKRMEWLKKEIQKKLNIKEHSKLMLLTTKLYEKGYSGLDLIYLLETNENFNGITQIQKYNFLILFNSVKKEIRNEKLLILFFLNFIILDKTHIFVSLF
jgi:DNA polymerase III delta prime subunit